MSIRNQVQLITYPDSLGGDLRALYATLEGPLAGLFGGIHILPFYPSSGDRGFAPITYWEVDARFGDWQDLRRLATNYQIVADLMVNHISRHSPYFRDFSRKGRRSEYAELFITLDKIWPSGVPDPVDVSRIFLRRPQDPFSEIVIEETGMVEQLWTTFGPRGGSEQIDLDINAPRTRRLLMDLLCHLRAQGVSIVRLDAVGFVIKKPGTSCFFVEPDTYVFLDWLRAYASGIGLILLPEVHARAEIQTRLAAHGYRVYNFVLPLLVLHTLFARSSVRLQEHLRTCPREQFTMLDCHDGIPVQPDLDGVLDVMEAQPVVERLQQQGANLSRLMAAHVTHPGFDAHQVNITYYSALDADDDAYLAARAIQCFAPGVPQIYYVGLLAGENDLAAVAATGERRAINRHNYTLEEIECAVQRPVVRRLMALLHFRNSYPAFAGTFSVLPTQELELRLVWRNADAVCALHVDLVTAMTTIHYTDEMGGSQFFCV